jgi:hypothetical protein
MNDKDLQKSVWLFVYDQWAPNTADVYNQFKTQGYSKNTILKTLKTLHQLGFVEPMFTDENGTFSHDPKARKKWPGTNMIWQSYINTDNYERDEAIAEYDNQMSKIK